MDATSAARRRSQRLTIVVSLAGAWLIAACTGCEWVSRSQNVTGVDLYEQGNYSGAIDEFQLAMQNNPGDADSYYNLGATYHRLGSVAHNAAYTQQAEQYYRLALEMDPNHVDCNRGMAVLMVEQNRPTEAFALLQNWSARNPASPDARIELARLYEEFGKPDIAQTHLQEALALQPDNPRALAALGKLKENSGDRTQALAIYQRSLEYNQFQPDVQSRVAALENAGVGIPATMPAAAPGTAVVAAPVVAAPVVAAPVVVASPGVPAVAPTVAPTSPAPLVTPGVPEMAAAPGAPMR